MTLSDFIALTDKICRGYAMAAKALENGDYDRALIHMHENEIYELQLEFLKGVLEKEYRKVVSIH